MDFGEKFIQDLMKGACNTEGFVRGSRVGVERQADRGHEEKLAAALGPLKHAYDKGLQDALAQYKIAFLGTAARLGAKALPVLKDVGLQVGTQLAAGKIQEKLQGPPQG